MCIKTGKVYIFEKKVKKAEETKSKIKEYILTTVIGNLVKAIGGFSIVFTSISVILLSR